MNTEQDPRPREKQNSRSFYLFYLGLGLFYIGMWVFLALFAMQKGRGH
jgi:hypothetical protein